jgi:hypothetical protein
MSQRIHVDSIEHLYVPTTIGGAAAATLDYEMAFTVYGSDADPTAWTAAEYDANTASARLLLGVDIALDIGEWMVWLRVTSAPEIPIRAAGRIVVYGEETT